MSSFLCTTLSSIPSFQEFIDNLLHHRSDAVNIYNPDVLIAIFAGIAILVGILILSFSKEKAMPRPKSMQLNNLLIVAAITCFIVVAVVASVINHAVVYDESGSLATISHSWNEILSFAVEDVHPPFYYLILKLIAILSNNNFFCLKLVSIVPAITTLCLTTVFLYKNISSQAATVFALCFLACSSMLHFGIELRMYSLAYCFVTLQALTCWHIIKTGGHKWWILFTLTTLCAAYSHLFAALTAGLTGMLLLIYILLKDRKKIKPFILSVLAALIIYAPQIIIALNQFFDVASGNFWIIDSTSFKAWTSYTLVIFSPCNPYLLYLCMAAFFAIALFAVFKKHKTEKDWYALACLACFALLLGISILISTVFRPVLVYRFLVPAIPLLLIFFAIEAASIKNLKIVRNTIYALIVLSLVACSTKLLRERNEGIKFDDFKSYITENATNHDVFIYSKSMKAADWLNLQMTGIISSMFQNHFHFTHVTSEFIDFGRGFNPKYMGDLFGKTFTDYDHFKITTEWHKNKIWISTLIHEDLESAGYLPVDTKNAHYVGQFGWSASQKFKLFRIDPQTLSPNETNQ
jgi:uncharacterized membrane protein